MILKYAWVRLPSSTPLGFSTDFTETFRSTKGIQNRPNSLKEIIQISIALLRGKQKDKCLIQGVFSSSIITLDLG